MYLVGPTKWFSMDVAEETSTAIKNLGYVAKGRNLLYAIYSSVMCTKRDIHLSLVLDLNFPFPKERGCVFIYPAKSNGHAF